MLYEGRTDDRSGTCGADRTEEQAEGPSAGSGRAVLVVDDNPTVAHALGGLLQAAGYAPAIFTTGHDALRYAQTHRLAAAVIDIHLPDISGLILSSGLRQQLGPHRPIIVVSGDSSMENLNSLTHVGVTCFFSKPVRASQLVQRLGELLS